VSSIQPPADLNRRHEVGVEAWDRQADEANEGRRLARKFHGPQTVAVLAEMSFDAIGKGIRFFSTQRAGEVFHDDRICIE
jgi:hypothetical protein